MNVSTAYRTVVLLLDPDREQERTLLKMEEGVFKFIKKSRLKLQGEIMRRMKESIPEISRRSIDLLSQRFTGSLGEKGIIPFDSYNSKFALENGEYFVDIRPARDTAHGQRLRIPCAKSEVPYYSLIEDLSQFPFFIARENDKWFAYVSLPQAVTDSEVVVGIDFNVRKWVAAKSSGSPVLFFDVSGYDREVEEIKRKLSYVYSRYGNEGRKKPNAQEQLEIDRLYLEREAVVKRAQGNFISEIINKFGRCTLHVEEVKTMYGMIHGLKSKKTNNWLNQKTSLSQFLMRAMAHGFRVKEVPPRGTSHTCFRCGSKDLEVYGDHERLIYCENCGLRNYNRDLNAARNIAASELREYL